MEYSKTNGHETQMTKVSWPSFIGIFLITIGNVSLVRRTRMNIQKKPGFHLTHPPLPNQGGSEYSSYSS
jgi:hypothetical protein